MQWRHEHHPLRKTFSGLVENAFCVEVGLCDPRLTDYVVALLLEFLHVDRLYKMRDAEGKRLESLAAMLAALETRAAESDPPARAALHRHIGDFALFWTGLFPEGLRNRRGWVNPDGLVDYVGHGKKAYAAASRLTDEDANPPRSVLRHLSREFEVCVHGLGLVRRGWERREFEGLDGDPHLLY